MFGDVVGVGVLVWHRAAGASHPYYPAEIADPRGSDMPKGLLAARPKTAVERIPILYFDEKRSGYASLSHSSSGSELIDD